MGHAKLAVLISRNWYGGYRCRFGGLLVPPAPLPLTTAKVEAGTLVVFGDYQIAPIAARSTAMGRCARWAQDIIACDAAERIIFAIVAGSGSGKLCWHSRGNDNDQENAGCVRESAGGSEQALRLRAQAGAFRAPARVTFFFCKKKVTKENHSNLRFKNPLARGGQVQIWRCWLRGIGSAGDVVGSGIACTACAAAADSSEGRGWYAGRFWRLSNRAHCGAKHRNG